MDWANTLSGLGVGLLVGMTGVGGGSLMAPILILFGYHPITAVGTDLWFAGITKSFGGFVHHRQGGVDRQVLRRLLIGSLPAAIITLLIMHWIGVAQIKKGVILNALGVVLIMTSVATLFRARMVRWSRRYQRAHGHDAPLNFQAPLTIAAGIFLGTMVTLTSVGAGALGVTLIFCLYPLRMKPRNWSRQILFMPFRSRLWRESAMSCLARLCILCTAIRCSGMSMSRCYGSCSLALYPASSQARCSPATSRNIYCVLCWRLSYSS